LTLRIQTVENHRLLNNVSWWCSLKQLR